ncbi:hypothetical protein GBAR_LOCUS12072 [Geodia barretti]|uniref:Calx-beta domain-containing protein n=1 Tax=Geodia barretti TaxID=519541 RepID=A0AA35WK86_GEOBA|nr:hypothetical protein GBAR_LOCUS12072 [Geodia barretti]
MYTTVGFLNSALEVSEFSEGGNLVVMASGFSPVGDIQVFLQYINGTARVGEDVGVEARSVTLDRETLSAVVPIFPLFDSLYEAEREFFTVRIVDVVGGVIDPERDTATVAVIDNTFLSVGGFVRDTSEGAGRAFVEFFIDGTNAVPLTLLFTATTTSEGAGFATAGEDFTELVDVPVVVEPGGLFPNVSITIINDLITEFPEQLQYFIRTEMPRIDISGRGRTFSILDDDFVRLAFNQMLATVSEGDGEIGFSLAVVEGSLGVDYSLNVSSTDSQNGGADAGSDFIPINEMFVLTFETTTVSFAITIIDDEVPEEAESFTFGVIPPQIEGLGVLLPEQAVVVIEDDDQLRVGFQTTTLTALESEEIVNVQIVVSGPSPPFLQMKWSSQSHC